MTPPTTRRQAVLLFAAGSLAAIAASSARAASSPGSARGDLLAEDASALRELTSALADAPRRRDFESVPMVLTRPDQWDDEALQLVIGYRGRHKQAFDNTELGGSWLNLMRNSLNAQRWSFGHPDFLAVSATHGSAHLALYNDAIWEKYRLAELTDGEFESNRLAAKPAEAPHDPQDPRGIHSAEAGNNIVALQRRGAVFIACHNAIWELASGRIESGVNPDRLSRERLAAELTNHLIQGVVLSPGAIGTLPELQMKGFAYAK